MPIRSALRLIAFAILVSAFAFAQQTPITWTDQEKPIAEQIKTLRSLPDDVRAHTTADLALRIRQLPPSANKLRLAVGLASLATEGDFGHDTLQQVTTTLADAIQEQQPKDQTPYLELASLVRYEHMTASLNSPEFTAAMTRLENEDRERQKLNFTLADLNGKNWTLNDLKGKVVLLNFWATWCPPCRKEMPDLEALYRRFAPQGLVILGTSDDEPDKIRAFIRQQGTSYPILLDPGSKLTESFHINGIPKTFVYDRDGKIVAQSIDMRTQRQFLEMLAQAGLK